MTNLMEASSQVALTILDEKIVNEIVSLQAEKQKLEAEAPTWAVNRAFLYNPNNQYSSVHIGGNQNVTELIEVASFIAHKESNYKTAATLILGLNTYPEWKWLGHTSDQWLQDIKTQLKTIDSQNQMDQIERRLMELNEVLPLDVKKWAVLNNKVIK